MRIVDFNKSLARLALLASVLALYCIESNAQTNKVILYYDAGNVVSRLDRISPISDGLRAILAMYAFQNGTGCQGGETYQCVLTDALEVDGQCSDKHLQLVQTWFKAGMPNMNWYGDGKTGSIDDMRSRCYNTPDTATFQRLWDLIRVSVSGTRVRVYGNGMWLARDDSGGFRFDTEYEIGSSEIRVVSHRDLLKKDKKQR